MSSFGESASFPRFGVGTFDLTGSPTFAILGRVSLRGYGDPKCLELGVGFGGRRI
jgi:hypothetical protein